MGSPYGFDRLYRSYSHMFDDDPATDFVTLSEEEKRKKEEEETFRNLPWYMRYDKEFADLLEDTAAGKIAKGIEVPFTLAQKLRDKLTSAIAGVPEQTFRETLEGAFPEEEFGKALGSVGEALGGGIPTDIALEEPIAAPPEITKPARELLFKGAELATDPSQLAPIGALGPVGAMLTAPVFGPKMISAGGEELGRGISAAESGDIPEALRLGVAGAADIGLGGLAVKHPLEAGGRALAEKIPSLEKPVGSVVEEALFPQPSVERGAVGDISKLNTFEDSQFRKYGEEWRNLQSPEEGVYHQSLLKGTASVSAPLSRLSEALTDPDLAPRIDQLVSEGYEVNRAVRIAKAERAEIPEEILTPEDVSDYMGREAEKEIPVEAEPILPPTLREPIKPPIEEAVIPVEPLIGTEEPMMAEPLRRGRPPKIPIKETLIPEEPSKTITKSEETPSEVALREDVTDIPKSLRAGFDVSFPGRQGLFLLNRPEGLKGIGRGFKSFQEREHLKIQEDLRTRPNADLYKQFGLEQIKYDPTQIEQRGEEIPAVKTIEAIPGFKQSARIFIDQGNLIRANVFDSLHEKWSTAGKTPENRPDLYKGVAKYLNVLTGRDTLPKRFAQAGYLLNKLMWSPRFVKSRLQLLNPVFYAKLPREVQLEALRDVGGTLGTLSILIGGATAAARQAGYDEKDVDVNTDPRATGFGKLKIRNVSYDFFTSLLPLIRTAVRITTGTKVTPSGEYQLGGLSGRTVLGIESELPKAPFGASVGSELATLGEGKLAPVPSVAKGLATGVGFAGEKYEIPQAMRDLFAPMAVAEFVEALNDYDAQTAAMTLPGLLGIGVQVEKRKGAAPKGIPFRKSRKSKKKRAW